MLSIGRNMLYHLANYSVLLLSIGSNLKNLQKEYF